MKEIILYTPKTLSFSRWVVKRLPQAVRNGLPAEISAVSVSEKESAGLNRRYRKKRTAANVLSFLYDKEYGEIIVCPSVIRREAREQRHTFDYQVTWMVAHGMIHLSGLDHEQSKAEERKFFAAERNVLDRIFNGAAKHHYGG